MAARRHCPGGHFELERAPQWHLKGAGETHSLQLRDQIRHLKVWEGLPSPVMVPLAASNRTAPADARRRLGGKSSFLKERQKFLFSVEHGVSDEGCEANWPISEKLGRLLGSTRAPITSAHFWVDDSTSSIPPQPPPPRPPPLVTEIQCGKDFACGRTSFCNYSLHRNIPFAW